MSQPKSSVTIDSQAYRKHKAKAKARSAAITMAGQDIAPIPPVRNPRRRAFGDDSFRFFCETYFPHLFSLAWSPDHLRVIEKIERVVKNRETLAIAMPRGSGKTTLCLVAVQWAILSGRHRFVYLVANTQEAALSMLSNIKSHLGSSQTLLEDYPDAVYPIRMLEGESKRCNGQRYYGIPTKIGWGSDELAMPTIPGSRCSGSIIRVVGITGSIRGALHVMPDGTQVRPSLVVCDDPQTDQSAKSPGQTADRLSVVNGAISGLAGPGEKTAIIIPCTVIQSGDLADKLLDRQENPHWHGERTKLIYQFPTNMRMWSEYIRQRQDSFRADGDGSEATAYYLTHRADMDLGASVAWAARFNASKGEVSAIQHAMNIRADVGEAAFCAEYQNEPLPPDLGADESLTAQQVAEKINGRERQAVPTQCTQITAFVDVHDKVLYWMVVAWRQDFTGSILDYGTWPDQRRPFFTMREVKSTLARAHPKSGREGAIQEGLKELTELLLSREWKRDDGAVMQIGRCFIDAGYVPEVIFSAVRRSNRLSVLLPSKGVGIGPDSKPFSEYIKRPGEQFGYHWRIPSTRGTRELSTVNIDTNFWNTFVLDRMATTAGDPGSLTLFGTRETDHRMLSEHLTSEFRIRTQGRRRVVDVWKPKPTGQDNHWLDCLVGCTVGAAMLGCALPGVDPAIRPGGGARIRLSDRQRSAR